MDAITNTNDTRHNEHNCSLNESAALAQLERWQLLRTGALEVVNLENGVTLRLPEHLRSVAVEAVHIEQDCCQFLDLSIDDADRADADGFDVTLTSTHDDGVALISLLLKEDHDSAAIRNQKECCRFC